MADGSPPSKRQKTEVGDSLGSQLPDELVPSSASGSLNMNNGPVASLNQVPLTQTPASSNQPAVAPMPSHVMPKPHPPSMQAHKKLTQLLQQGGHNSPKYVQTPSPSNSNAINSPRPPRQPSQPQPSPLSTSHASLQSPSAGSMAAVMNNMKSPPGSSLPRPNSRPGSAMNATPSPRPPGGPMSANPTISSNITTSFAPTPTNAMRSPMMQNQIQQQNISNQGQVMHSGLQQGVQKYMVNGPNRTMQGMPQQGMVNSGINRPNTQNNVNVAINMGPMANQQTNMAHYNNSMQPHMQPQISPMNQMANSIGPFGQQQQTPVQGGGLPIRQMPANNSTNSVFSNMPVSRPRQGLISQSGGMTNQISGVSMGGMGPTGMPVNSNVNVQMLQQPSGGNIIGMDKQNSNMQFNQMRPGMPSVQPANNIQALSHQQQINRLANQLDPQSQNLPVNVPSLQVSNQPQLQQHIQVMPQNLGQANALPQPPGNAGPGPPQSLGQVSGGALQSGTSNNSASADPEKRRLIQQQLVLLLHAYKCAKKEHSGEAPNCTLPHCRTMKEVLRHMNQCQQGKSCQVAHCASSRQIIAHWRACSRQDCVVCLPLKSVPNNNNAQVPGATLQQRWPNAGLHSTASIASTSANANPSVTVPSYPAQMNDPLMNANVLQTNHANVTGGLSGLPNGLTVTQVPGMPQVLGGNPAPESSNNLFHASRVEREWHKDVTEELRNHLVQKLVQAIFPTPQKVSLTDERMKKLVTFAKKVEGDMYEQANSRSEYYHLLAEKIYKIQKELEEKRAQRIRSRPAANQRMAMNNGPGLGVGPMPKDMGMEFLEGPGRMPGPSMSVPQGNSSGPIGIGQQIPNSSMVQSSMVDSMIAGAPQSQPIGNQATTNADYPESIMNQFQKAKDEIRQQKSDMASLANNQSQGMPNMGQIHLNTMQGNLVGGVNGNMMSGQTGINNFSQQQQGNKVPQNGGNVLQAGHRPPSVGQMGQFSQPSPAQLIETSSSNFSGASMMPQSMHPKTQTSKPRLESLLLGSGTPTMSVATPGGQAPMSGNNYVGDGSSFEQHPNNSMLLQKQLRLPSNGHQQQQFTSNQPSSLQEMLQGSTSSSVTSSTTTTTVASSAGLTTSLNSSAPATVLSSSPSPFVSKPQISAGPAPMKDIKMEVADTMPFGVPNSGLRCNISNFEASGKDMQIKSEAPEPFPNLKPTVATDKVNMSAVSGGKPWSPSKESHSSPAATTTSVTTVSVDEVKPKMENDAETYSVSATSSASSTTTTLSPFVKQESMITTISSASSAVVPAKQKCPKKVFDPMELKAALMPVVEKLYKQEPEALPFRQPVDPEKLNIPDYFDIVKEPMDLASIKKNLEIGKYKEPWEFMGDIWLMFNNAWLYNRRTTRVYKYCSKLKEIFEAEIDPVMQSLGYCCGRKMEFMPMTLCCYGKQLCTIPTGATYYEYQNRYDYCEKCFNEIPGDAISLADDPSKPQSSVATILKSQFEKKKNDVLDPEPFETCNVCGRKMHKICVLHMSPIWPEGFTCDECHAARNTQRKPSRYVATKLPQNKLGEHIERRVNNYIKRQDTHGEAGHVHIRVVYSGDKTVEVRSGMKARFVDTKEMPESFPYRAKAFFAFEEIDGVDVCFFGVHVQEYGSDAPKPNQRRVYLSYLDSVHFFRPRHLRTAVYHEILIGYFEYCKNLGYEFAHIWACPPCEGDDYIFHCHPPEQKIPKPKRLQDWYKKMLDKAISEQVIVDYKDIFHQAKEDRLQSARELPYFEGDFWPNVLEESIKEIEQEEEDRKQAEANEQAAAEESDQGSNCNSKNGKNKKSKKASSKKASQRTTKKKLPQVANDLSDKLYQTMEKHKEVFFVIRLHSVETISKMGPTVDPDGPMQCDLMDGRDAFLTLAREKHYEFSSLRRAKWSTMAMLVELHTQGQDKFSYMCNHCRNNVETRYQCTVCHDFDLCSSCYHLIGHEHKMDKMGFGLDDGGSPGSGSSNKKSPHIPVERCMQSLVHACQCRNANCSMTSCMKMKKVVQHARNCKKKCQGTCLICKQLIAMCCYHAKHCQEKKCPVAFCHSIKNKLKQQELQHRVQQAYLMRRRMKVMSRNITQAGPNTPSTAAPGTPQQNQSSPKSQMTPDHHMHKPQPSPMTSQELVQHSQPKQNIPQHGIDPGVMAGPHTPGNVMTMQMGNTQVSQHPMTSPLMGGSQQQYVRNSPMSGGVLMSQQQQQQPMGGLASPMSVGHAQQQGIMSPQSMPANFNRKYSSPPPEAAVRAAKAAQHVADQQAKEREKFSTFIHNPQPNANQMGNRPMNPAMPRAMVPGSTGPVGWSNQMQHRAPMRPMMPNQAPNMVGGGPQPVSTANNVGTGLMTATPNSNQALRQVINLLKNQPGGSGGRMNSSEQLMAFLKTNPQLMSTIIKERKQALTKQQLNQQQKQIMTHQVQAGMPVTAGNVQQGNMGSGGMQQMVMQNTANQPVMNMQQMPGGMGNLQQMQWQQQQQRRLQQQQQQQGRFQQPAPPYPQAISQQRLMNARLQQQQQQQHRMQPQIRHQQINQQVQGGIGMQQGMMGQVSNVPGVQSPLQNHPGMMNAMSVNQVGGTMGGQPVPSSRPPSQPIPSGRVVPQMSPHQMAGRTTPLGQGQAVNQGAAVPHVGQSIDQQFNPSGTQASMMMGGFNRGMNPHASGMGFGNGNVNQELGPSTGQDALEHYVKNE